MPAAIATMPAMITSTTVCADFTYALIADTVIETATLPSVSLAFSIVGGETGSPAVSCVPSGRLTTTYAGRSPSLPSAARSTVASLTTSPRSRVLSMLRARVSTRLVTRCSSVARTYRAPKMPRGTPSRRTATATAEMVASRTRRRTRSALARRRQLAPSSKRNPSPRTVET